MSTSPKVQPRALEQLVAEAIASIRYRAVEITIHDGRMVRIEKREKLRPGTSSNHADGQDGLARF